MAHGRPLGEALPFVSIIIPMRNEQSYIEETLTTVLRQDYPPDRFEVIVADGRSTDVSGRIVRERAAQDPRLRVVDNPRLSASSGRNVGIRVARGEIIAIVDAHCYVGLDFLASVARLFAETGADCLARPIEQCLPQDGYLQRTIAVARASPLGGNPLSDAHRTTAGWTDPESAAVIYRRKVFDRLGFFDERLTTHEDVEFNTRVRLAGMRCWFSPSLCYYFHARRTLWGLFLQMYRYGRHRMWFLAAYPEGFRPAFLLPLAVLAILLCSAALAALSQSGRWLLSALAAAYALAIAIASLRSARRYGWGYVPALPAAFATIHAGITLGSAAGIVFWLRRAFSQMAPRARRSKPAIRVGRNDDP
jgi:glycosyltransferase involved in cell wall biosynthesis